MPDPRLNQPQEILLFIGLGSPDSEISRKSRCSQGLIQTNRRSLDSSNNIFEQMAQRCKPSKISDEFFAKLEHDPDSDCVAHPMGKAVQPEFDRFQKLIHLVDQQTHFLLMLLS
jgi:hypothetical protein